MMEDLKNRGIKVKYIVELIEFLEKLEEKKIYYKLNKVRENTIMIEVVVPGERWEIELNSHGTKQECDIEVERFIGNGEILNESLFEELFERFSD